jgi:uncharacterized LabA/DUF88 family protein
MEGELKYAAIFIDFENIFYFLRQRVVGRADYSEIAIDTIRNLRKELLEKHRRQCIIQYAYADFERIGGSAQGAFYLIGVETLNVLGTDHKNAADMRLCIDAIETLYMRPEIETFVFVAGDRDYIPVVQHLRKRAKTVLVVSFKENVSGDLIQVAEERNFIDASTILPPGIQLQTEPRSEPRPAKPTVAPPVPAVAKDPRPVVQAPQVPTFARPTPLARQDEQDALRIMLDYFGDKPEIWFTPYLHRQRQEMTHLAEYERRSLINELVDKGAIAIEKRPGAQGEYSVILVNYNHEDVRLLTPG